MSVFRQDALVLESGASTAAGHWEVKANDDGTFDLVTGAYEAPRAGVYFLTAHIKSEDVVWDAGDVVAALFKHTAIGGASEDLGASEWKPPAPGSSDSAVIDIVVVQKMSAGDTVALYLTSSHSTDVSVVGARNTVTVTEL